VSRPWWLLPLIAAFVAAWVFAGPPAKAHDWYSSTSDPVYQSSCCGGHDCAPIDSAWVSQEPGGYRLRMTIEQSRTVNPSSQAPVNALVPWSRVQSPPHADHEFYACIYDRDRARPREGVICFFATPTM
jgi:hypothetical protein